MTEPIDANAAHAVSGLRQMLAMAQHREDYLDFYRRERPRLCAILSLLTTDTRYLDDAAQDALLIACHHWEKIRDYEKPEAWLLKVALRILRRWQARDYQRLRPLHEADNSEDTHATEVYALSDDYRDLIDAVRSLPPRQRECIVLHYLRDHPVAHVADILAAAESHCTWLRVTWWSGRPRQSCTGRRPIPPCGTVLILVSAA